MHPRTAELQNKILNSINERMPIVANNGCSLTLENLSFKEPDGLNDIAKQLEIKYKKNGNLNGYLRGRIVIKDKDGKVTSKGNMMNIIPVPYHTDRGTFLVNGNEKSVQSQMRLKPGSYTTKNPENNTVKTLISFQRKVGSYAPMITVTFEKTKGDFKVKINQTNFNGVDFLRALMFSDQDIARVINDSTIYDSIIKKGRGSKTPSDLYKAIIGKNPKFNDKKAIAEELYEYFRENAKFGTGEKVAQNLLGLNKGDTISLTKPVLERAFRKTFELANGKIENDDVDDIRFKDIYSGEDLIAERVEDSIDKFINKCIPMLEDTKTFNSINASTFTPVIKLHDDVNQFITKNSIVQSPEETNPLFIAAMGAKITQLGERGMSRDSTRGNNSARNLSVSGFNKIDPIETPESQSIGYDQHLALGAKIKDKTIETELIKVSNGKVSSKKENVTIEDEYNSKVAFYDTKYVSKENGKYEFTAAEVPGRYKGKMMNIPVNEIQYMDTTAHNMLGITANMIPFVSHDDGARALMGTNMQKQAINLANREVPHVTTATPDGSTYDELIGNNYGKPVKSGVDGVVEKIDNTKIIIRGNDGSKNVYQYYNYFPLNQSFINNELKVKKGDRVKKGQMIAEGWQTKDGKLALGINTRIGYMPYKGYNYEDGVVISKSYAEKMRTDEKDEIEIDIPDDYLGGKGSRVQPQLSGYTTRPDVKQKLDSDGIIKVGESVKSGSTLVAALRPIKNGGGDSLVDTIIQGKSKDLKYQFNPFKIENESYLKGEVKRITAVDNPSPGIKQKIIITLVSSNPLKEGDKVSGRHGNKGTITKILDDKLMPATEDGKPLDLLFSPLAIPSRKNLGQMLEVNAGLIAEKTGKQYVVNNFDHKEKDKVLEKLKEIGCPDGKMKVTYKEELSDGTVVDVPVENPINVGSMYIMKLKHKVDDKIQHRSNIETAPNIQDHMPTKKSGVAKGEKANPQSMGWMEMSAMQSHGAAWNILESSTIKADGGGDIKQRVAMFKAISSGKLDSRDLDVSAAPETVKVFADNLKALGMNVTPLHNGKPVSFNQVYDGLTVAPMKSSDMIKMIGKENEVTNSGLFEARGFYDPGKNRGDDENSATRKGGLLDPSIFGHMNSADSRNKWGYIKLTTPIVNPVFMNDKSHNPYALATGMKSDDLKSLSLGKKVLVIDPSAYTGFDNMSKEDKKSYIDDVKASMISAGVKPGDLVEPRALENLMEEHGQILWKAGGESIQYLLDRVDVKKELKKAEGELAKAKGKSIDACYKKCRALKNLVDNDMEASDLMMHHIPVAPTYLRPVMPDKRSGSVMYDDLNKLYENLIKANNSTKNVVENGFDLMTSLPPVEAASVSAGIFNNFSNITGVTQAKDSKKKTELNGIKQNLIEKSGLIRNKMTAKRVDFSGRAVIGVDPNLTLNEAGIPMDMAIGLYRPFLEKELVSKGYAKNAEEASRKINTADNDVKKVLQFLADDRPLILNRAPTLHKLGIQAMRPIIIDNPKGSPVRSIKLNPLIVPAYNADFDGDTMAAHVPISDKAKEEAKNLMMPSQKYY